MNQRRYPFEAIWLSPSSLSDFEKCPRLYYLRNAYKNRLTQRKIQVANPFMSLGIAVHKTVETISILPKDRRFDIPLTVNFENFWKDLSGKIGGFLNEDQEEKFKQN